MSRISIRTLLVTAVVILLALASTVPMAAGAQEATPETACPPLSPDAIQKQVQAYVDAVKAEDTGRLGDVLHPDHQHHWAVNNETIDRQGYLDRLGDLFDAYDNFSFTVDEILLADGAAVVRVTASGTQILDFHGYPPSDQPATFTGILIFKFDDCGQIVESWAQFDHLGRLISQGSIEAPTEGTPAP